MPAGVIVRRAAKMRAKTASASPAIGRRRAEIDDRVAEAGTCATEHASIRAENRRRALRR